MAIYLLQISISGMDVVEPPLALSFLSSIPMLVVQVGDYCPEFHLPFHFCF